MYVFKDFAVGRDLRNRTRGHSRECLGPRATVGLAVDQRDHRRGDLGAQGRPHGAGAGASRGGARGQNHGNSAPRMRRLVFC